MHLEFVPAARPSADDIAQLARAAGKRPVPPTRPPAELRITFRPPTAPPVDVAPASPRHLGRTAWTFAAGVATGLSVLAAYTLLSAAL
jgi:hypothetical protein